jgi:RNA polymerase sigma-54 factor
MRLETSQHMRLDQRMILAPRMIQSMEILQMPLMELQERVEQEMSENPVLELKEAEADDVAEPPAEKPEPTDGPTDLEKELVVDLDKDELDFNRLDALSKDWEDHFNEEHRPSRNGMDASSDKKHDAMQNTPARPPSLHDYLYEQFNFLDVPPEIEGVARHLVSYIDERGYLAVPLAEALQAYEKPVPSELGEQALAFVQRLDPPGIGARDLRECLLLQLTPDTPNREMLRVLIEHHLEDIKHNRLPLIQRKTGYDLGVIKEAIEGLRHLTLHPGSGFSTEPVAYVVPDIAVEQNEDGSFAIRILDDYIPNIYISRRYVDMLKNKDLDPKDREYLKRKVQSAQWLLESIEQRRSTLEKVTRKIMEHQRGFLEHGPEHIEPLKMQQIAEQVGVHVTTISRAVGDKWVQTPRGVFSLKRFFGGGTTMATGEEVAYETIKQKLFEIIGKEDKANPLSDEDLMNKLQETGYPLARRTVTKYRKMLRIPSSRQRKDWTITHTSSPSQGAP